MSLLNVINTNHPLIWVVSDEPAKVYEMVSSFVKDRKLLRLDAIKGLLSYDKKEQSWLNVIVKDPDMDQYTIITSIGQSLSYALDNKSTLIIDNAHNFADKILDVCVSLHTSHRDMILEDDMEHLPSQLIMISHENEPPREISRYTSVCYIGLPNDEELSSLYENILDIIALTKKMNSALIYGARRRRHDFVRAARGLSESEVIDTCISQLQKNKDISVDEVNRYKLELLKNNGILEIRNPNSSKSDIGGLDNAKELLERIRIARSKSDHPDMKRFGVSPINKLLLIGVPGSGKSLFCEAAATALNLDLAKGGISSSMSKWVGQSEENTRRMFATLNRMSPVVFWIDEFGRDMSGSQSSSAVDGGTTDRVHGEFLTGIQELDDDILLVAAANRIQDLPPEMTRADRFDKVMFVGFPTMSERIEILKLHTADLQSDFDIDLEQIAEVTDMFTGAELKSLINEVKFEHFTQLSNYRDTKTRLNTATFIEKSPHVKGRIWVNHRDDMVEMYKRAVQEWDWASSEQYKQAEHVLSIAKNGSNSASYSPVSTKNLSKPEAGPKKIKWG